MPKVLIIDDAAFMRAMLRKILTQVEFEVAEAGSGPEAIRAYADWRLDVVTMDITMPEMDGIEALRRLKASHPEAKVITCSAMGQESLVRDAIRAGASDFIVKPFKPERVLQAFGQAKVCPAQMPREHEVNVIVGFTRGVQGQILFGMSKRTATKLASVLLMDDLPQWGEVTTSGIGEIANIVAGGCAAALHQHGFSANITVPSVIAGDDTIFIAVTDRHHQRDAIRAIWDMFAPR